MIHVTYPAFQWGSAKHNTSETPITVTSKKLMTITGSELFPLYTMIDNPISNLLDCHMHFMHTKMVKIYI